MKIKHLYIYIIASLFVTITSCNKYLDELPDNRAELNNADKISRILVSAYPTSSYIMQTELSSDNTDDYGSTNPYSTRILGQIYNWEDQTENDDDAANAFWEASYKAIASSNAALSAIKEAGNPTSLNPQKGEALVARAYNHFMLVNVFGLHYSKTTSKTDLGVTYMLEPETTLSPKYERNTVAEVYELAVKDLEEGIPLIDDSKFVSSSAAKYHFNKTAAYAFAARLYLYMGEWEKAADYSTKALGSDATASLRNYAQIVPFTSVFNNTSREYNSSTLKANFLVLTSGSNIGATFGPYYENSRFNHNAYLTKNETLFSSAPYLAKQYWPLIEAGQTVYNALNYRIRAYIYSGTNLDKSLLPHVAYMFEYTDPVAGIGFRRAVVSEFTSEEAVLTRAEANIHLKKYADALKDMQLWAGNTVNFASTMTESIINEWGDHFAYYTPTAPTPKKKFNNKDYIIDPGTQENMLHAVLYMRRIQTLHVGLRWFDLKRYGIEVNRRTLSGGKVGSVSTNVLKSDDKRRAIQLPLDVISAGLTPNPR
ncbi:RagB/SusD family nutrient uptake outer membrane protein [Sphingobacterium sp. SRCM116780]|uniref:RagB/SusD family nutrient uptake outer membrane protein n=1 Tax=Sphingobacterium sp. SRCM116780 TaxID=2907623 RepID=UPI001F195383|nr:RagB/SusD family nutrient uptake outer membrane protein [Sphingobacterium sp. SRCM116780]UIR56264.1 RagB/SusD family nutrient uptake outer membrane protein [Sphingobacterium sp. SRCM116780]